MKTKLTITCAAFSLMTACGGSGSGSSADVTSNIADDVTLSELQARFETFQAAIGTPNLDDAEPTNFADLPTSGLVNYTGAAVVGSGEDDGMGDVDFTFLAVGSATLVANFDNQKIAGTADNFFQIDDPNAESLDGETGTRISGSLTYEFDQVSAGVNEYAGQITGSLTPTDQPVVSIDIGGIAGFAGDNGEAFISEAFNNTDDEFVAILATKN